VEIVTDKIVYIKLINTPFENNKVVLLSLLFRAGRRIMGYWKLIVIFVVTVVVAGWNSGGGKGARANVRSILVKFGE